MVLAFAQMEHLLDLSCPTRQIVEHAAMLVAVDRRALVVNVYVLARIKNLPMALAFVRMEHLLHLFYPTRPTAERAEMLVPINKSAVVAIVFALTERLLPN